MPRGKAQKEDSTWLGPGMSARLGQVEMQEEHSRLKECGETRSRILQVKSDGIRLDK